MNKINEENEIIRLRQILYEANQNLASLGDAFTRESKPILAQIKDLKERLDKIEEPYNGEALGI